MGTSRYQTSGEGVGLDLAGQDLTLSISTLLVLGAQGDYMHQRDAQALLVVQLVY